MKVCPSCGAELDDNATKCPICDFVLPAPEVEAEIKPKAEELPEESVPSLLDEMKARIQSIAGTAKEEAPPKELEPAPEEAPFEEAMPAEEKVEEAPEEIVGAEAEPRRQHMRKSITLPGMGAAKVETPKSTKQGYKISASDATEKGRGGILLAAIAIIVVLIMVFAAWYFFVNNPFSGNPSVDGYFDEWTDTVKYQSYFPSDNIDMDFMETAVQYFEKSVYWYFSTSGPLFDSATATSPIMATYALFVDADGDPWTGYSLMEGFGADNFLSVTGSSGQKNDSFTKLYEFEGTDELNWSSWKALEPLTIAMSGKRVETSFLPSDNFNSTYAKFIAVSFDGAAKPSASLPFSIDPGILLIKQTSIITSNGIIAYGSDRPILQLDIIGYGAAKPIEMLRPTLTGVSGSYNLGPVDWNETTMGEGRSFLFTINTSVSDNQKLVEATMTQAGVVSDYSSVVILGAPAKGYVGAIPSGKVIDGIFKDWTNAVEDQGDAPIGNNDIDIELVGNETGASKTYFYVKTLGQLFNGVLIPVGERIPSPSMQSGIGGDERLTGENIVRIYIDKDPASNTGAPTPINGTNMRPDLMIEISGRNGVITGQEVKYWTTDWYGDNSVTLKAAVSGSSLETSISVGNLENATFAVVVTDWVGHSDNMTCKF